MSIVVVFSQDEYQFTIKPIFSTLGSIIELSGRKPLNDCVQDIGIGGLIGFDTVILYEKVIYHINQFTFSHLTAFSSKLTWPRKKVKVQKNERFARDVDPGNSYIKKIRGGVQWYLVESKDFISNPSFKKNMKKLNQYLLTVNR